LIIALGTAIGDAFDINRLRYGKIIIATDADVDGAHIRTLLLTLFYRYFHELVEAGNIYIAMPPLYKIKQGKKIDYVYTEEEKVKLLGKDIDIIEEEPGEGEEIEESEESEEAEDTTKKDLFADKAGKKAKPSLQRYKGLGEMNPDELWETTMNPETRLIKKVNIEDAEEADRTFDILMGTDVPSRKSFIQSHAKEATLDY